MCAIGRVFFVVLCLGHGRGVEEETQVGRVFFVVLCLGHGRGVEEETQVGLENVVVASVV